MVIRQLLYYYNYCYYCTNYYYYYYNSCLRLRGSCITRLSVLLPHILLTTDIFCRTLVIAHWGLIPTTSGCHEHTTNLVIGVCWQPALDCGTTFNPSYGGQDSPSILSDDLLATEAPSDSFDLYVQSIYLLQQLPPNDRFSTWIWMNRFPQVLRLQQFRKRTSRA